MDNAYRSKKRNSCNRKRTRIILLSVEGNNQTEKLYFGGFHSKNCRIMFAKGNATDPVKMAKSLKQDYHEKQLSNKQGDLSFCVIDGDLSKDKEKQIILAEEELRGIQGQVIVSNPCFEVWFLCHYTDSTRQYTSGDDVIRRLRDYIPNYEKNMKGLSDQLSDKINLALVNAEKLEEYNKSVGRQVHKSDYQPSTEVPMIIRRVI